MHRAEEDSLKLSLTALTILHPLTDAISAALFMYLSKDIWQVFLYNFVAFALQLPIGWVLDALPCSLRHLQVASAALLALSVVFLLLGLDPVVAIALSCLGNALFHVSAGKHLLERSDGKAFPVSLYISTGAIGLFAGMRFGHHYSTIITVGSLLAFAAVLAIAWSALRGKTGSGKIRPLIRPVPSPHQLWLLLPLLALVVWRSYGVLLATGAFGKLHSALSLILALMFASWAGQAVGGWLSDRLGWLKVLVVSIIGSAALLWVCPTSSVIGYLALMFAAQLATGPVMVLLYRFCLARGGLAFGLNCLALFISTLFITGVPYAAPHYLAGDLLAIALEYMVTAWVGLPYWFFAIALVNIVTHPALMYAINVFGFEPMNVAIGEASVVLIEALILMLLYHNKSSRLKLLLLSLIMNAFSYFMGELLFWRY